MYMFRSKRNNLIKRLLKARKLQLQDTNQNETICENEIRDKIFKQLKEIQLELLLNAIESEGSENSSCVLIAKSELNFSEPDFNGPDVLCCRMFRWPDLVNSTQLKRLPICASAHDPVYICCNPYHLSRMAIVDFNDCPPPYERFESERLRPEDRAPSELPMVVGNRTGSFSTSGEGGPWAYRTPNGVQVPTGEWCRLAYWELGRRVGRQFNVDRTWVNVFNESMGPRIDCGLHLASLVKDQEQSGQLGRTPEQVLRTRNKIKHGVILSREPDGVWCYNISKVPIFLNSPFLGCLPYPQDTSNNVIRISPGECILAYRPSLTFAQNSPLDSNSAAAILGPKDPFSVRLSFAKGWGRGYSRTDIVACPCWLEILLAPCR